MLASSTTGRGGISQSTWCFSFTCRRSASSRPPSCAPADGLLGGLARIGLSVWMMYYLVASMRHFYEDGWMRTLFKAFLLVVLYMALFTPIYFAVVAAGM